MRNNTQTADLLANDIWAMGAVLVFMLAGHLIFGTNHEDGAEAVSKYRNPETQKYVSIIKQAQWVRLLSWEDLCKRKALPKQLSWCMSAVHQLSKPCAVLPADNASCVAHVQQQAVYGQAYFSRLNVFVASIVLQQVIA